MKCYKIKIKAKKIRNKYNKLTKDYIDIVDIL